MTARPLLFDSTDPAAIPAQAHKFPNGVLAYLDGQYRWPAPVDRLFPRWVPISARPLRIDPEAWHARVADIEAEDYTPEDFVAFYHKRRAGLGAQVPIVAYCNRSTVAAVLEACRAGGVPIGDFHWHISTLDGYAWQPQQLAAEIARLWGARIDPALIWAIQWLPGGSYDMSTIYGAPQWRH